MLSIAQLLTLLARTKPAQDAIVRSGRPDLRRALAASPFLHTQVADTLARSKDMPTSTHALRICQDQDVLERASRDSVLRARWALRNPNAPERLLTDARLTNNDPALLACLLNQNTPLEYRRAKLTPDTAARLVNVGGSVSYGVVRAFELALANPWMLETPAAWPQRIRRGLSGLPEVTQEQYAALAKGRTPWQSKDSHPCLLELDLATASFEELARLAHPAVDLYLLEHRGLTEELASRLITRVYNHPTEPHIIGRIVSMYGVGALHGASEPDCERVADTRTIAASFTHPAAQYIGYIQWDEWVGTSSAADMLSDNAEAWLAALTLADSWHASPEELAETAIGLTR